MVIDLDKNEREKIIEGLRQIFPDTNEEDIFINKIITKLG